MKTIQYSLFILTALFVVSSAEAQYEYVKEPTYTEPIIYEKTYTVTDQYPPTVALSVSPTTVEQGGTIVVTVTGTDDVNLAAIWFWGEKTGDASLDKAHWYDCSGTKATYSWKVSTANLAPGTYVLGANSRDAAYGDGNPHQASEGKGIAYVKFSVTAPVPVDQAPPTVDLTITPLEVEYGGTIEVTVSGTDDLDLAAIWWWGEGTGDTDLDKAHWHDCSGTSATNTLTVSIANLAPGTYQLGANSRDAAYPVAGEPHQASEGAGIKYVSFIVGEQPASATATIPVGTYVIMGDTSDDADPYTRVNVTIHNTEGTMPINRVAMNCLPGYVYYGVNSLDVSKMNWQTPTNLPEGWWCWQSSEGVYFIWYAQDASYEIAPGGSQTFPLIFKEIERGWNHVDLSLHTGYAGGTPCGIKCEYYSGQCMPGDDSKWADLTHACDTAGGAQTTHTPVRVFDWQGNCLAIPLLFQKTLGVFPEKTAVGIDTPLAVAVRVENRGKYNGTGKMAITPYVQSSSADFAVDSGPDPAADTLVPEGQYQDYIFNFIGTKEGEYTVEAWAEDPKTGDISNHVVSVPITVVSIAPTMVVDPDPVFSGQTVTVSMIVDNYGAVNATDIIPGTMEFKTSGNAAVTAVSGPDPAFLSSIAAGGAGTIRWTYTITGDPEDLIKFGCTMTSDQIAPLEVPVFAEASIAKYLVSVAPGEIAAGATSFPLAFTVMNNSSTDVDMFRVITRDPDPAAAPPHISIPSVDGLSGGYGGNWTPTISGDSKFIFSALSSSLPPGNSCTFTVPVDIDNITEDSHWYIFPEVEVSSPTDPSEFYYNIGVLLMNLEIALEAYPLSGLEADATSQVQIKAIVTKQNGDPPASPVDVTFLTDNGVLSPTVVTTDGAGMAGTVLTAPSGGGTQKAVVTASVSGITKDIEVRFGEAKGIHALDYRELE